MPFACRATCRLTKAFTFLALINYAFFLRGRTLIWSKLKPGVKL